MVGVRSEKEVMAKAGHSISVERAMRRMLDAGNEVRQSVPVGDVSDRGKG